MRTEPRVYGGRSLEQRQAERRTQLMTAAIELWRERGWSGVTMRAVCARARVTDRYFYEHFSDRDALLVAVWNHARDSVVDMVLDAVRGVDRSGLLPALREVTSVLVLNLGDDPHGAQLLFSADLGAPALQRCRQQTLDQLTDLLVTLARPHLKDGVDINDVRMSTLMGIGGFAELVTAWRAGTITGTGEQIIDHAARISAVLIGQYVHPHTSTIMGMARSVLERIRVRAIQERLRPRRDDEPD